MPKKKKTGRNETSRGQRNNVSKKLLNACRRERAEDPGLRLSNQLKALKKKKRVVFTIPNPNQNETNKRFIRVAATELGAVKET